MTKEKYPATFILKLDDSKLNVTGEKQIGGNDVIYELEKPLITEYKASHLITARFIHDNCKANNGAARKLMRELKKAVKAT